MVTLRPVRPVRAAETPAAQAAEPQASVRPAPRSQVRVRRLLSDVTCASVMFAFSGNIGWFSSSGPKRSRSKLIGSLSTQKIACGLPIDMAEGECSTGLSIGPICNSMRLVSKNSSDSGILSH